MKSKFFIWYIPLLIVMCCFIVFKLVSINNKKLNLSDLYNISENNVYKVIKEDELKDILEKKTGIVLFATSSDTSSRNVVTLLNDAVMKTNIPQVYYYDINDISSSLKEYLLNSLNGKVDSIDKATVLYVNAGDVYKVYQESRDNELSEEEKEKLRNDFQDTIMDFVSTCDESC